MKAGQLYGVPTPGSGERTPVSILLSGFVQAVTPLLILTAVAAQPVEAFPASKFIRVIEGAPATVVATPLRPLRGIPLLEDVVFPSQLTRIPLQEAFIPKIIRGAIQEFEVPGQPRLIIVPFAELLPPVRPLKGQPIDEPERVIVSVLLHGFEQAVTPLEPLQATPLLEPEQPSASKLIRFVEQEVTPPAPTPLKPLQAIVEEVIREGASQLIEITAAELTPPIKVLQGLPTDAVEVSLPKLVSIPFAELTPPSRPLQGLPTDAVELGPPKLILIPFAELTPPRVLAGLPVELPSEGVSKLIKIPFADIQPAAPIPLRVLQGIPLPPDERELLSQFLQGLTPSAAPGATSLVTLIAHPIPTDIGFIDVSQFIGLLPEEVLTKALQGREPIEIEQILKTTRLQGQGLFQIPPGPTPLRLLQAYPLSPDDIVRDPRLIQFILPSTPIPLKRLYAIIPAEYAQTELLARLLGQGLTPTIATPVVAAESEYIIRARRRGRR